MEQLAWFPVHPDFANAIKTLAWRQELEQRMSD